MKEKYNPFDQEQGETVPQTEEELEEAKEEAGVVNELDHLVRMIKSGDSKLLEKAVEKIATEKNELLQETLRQKSIIKNLKNENKALGGFNERERIGNIDIYCSWGEMDRLVSRAGGIYEISIAEINDEEDSSKNKYPGYLRISTDPDEAREVFKAAKDAAEETGDAEEVYKILQSKIKSLD